MDHPLNHRGFPIKGKAPHTPLVSPKHERHVMLLCWYWSLRHFAKSSFCPRKIEITIYIYISNNILKHLRKVRKWILAYIPFDNDKLGNKEFFLIQLQPFVLH
jgi:hypothetical protein